MSKRVLVWQAPRPSPQGTSIITDPLEIRRLLNRASTSQAAASLKPREPGESSTVMQGTIADTDIAHEGLVLKLRKPLGVAEKKLFGARECMALIYLQGRSILGINAVPRELRRDHVVFAMPSRLFKIQRRKDVRYQIPAAYEFTVEMDSPDSKLDRKGARIRKRIIDLSESGLSFFVLSPREAGLFRRGMFLHRCMIRLQNQRIVTSLKIRNSLPFDRGKQGAGHKIGAEFEDLLPDDRDAITQFVYSHAEHLFY